MKALVLTDYMKLEYMDVPLPVFHPDEVLVEVKAAGICGSDVQGMDGSTGRRIPPLIMGHEASGIITDTGRKVTGWKRGDRVAFESTIYPLDDWYAKNGLYNLSDGRKVLGVSTPEFRRDGAFAQCIAVPHHILHKIPENVSFTRAAMTEPASVALHAVQITPISPGCTTLVVGAGIIGSFIIQILKQSGCREIIAVDTDNHKLSLAKQMGATLVLDPTDNDIPGEVRKISGERGADIAFEAVGISRTVSMAIESVRKGGFVTLVGNTESSVEIPLQYLVTRQIRLQGSCAMKGEYPDILQMISDGRINVDLLLSAEAPLYEGAEWFRRLYEREPGLMKVILNPAE